MFRILFCFLGCLSLWVHSESLQYKFSDIEKIEISADQLEISLDESNLTTILDLGTKPVKNKSVSTSISQINRSLKVNTSGTITTVKLQLPCTVQKVILKADTIIVNGNTVSNSLDIKGAKVNINIQEYFGKTLLVSAAKLNADINYKLSEFLNHISKFSSATGSINLSYNDKTKVKLIDNTEYQDHKIDRTSKEYNLLIEINGKKPSIKIEKHSRAID